jgi:6-phosphofructokinase
MTKPSRTRCIGILTSGGDCPGLNPAIRGITKAAIQDYGIKVVGILDGFRGLVENRTFPLESQDVSGILTRGGTILGTSRDKPKKMLMGGKIMDMTATAIENARNLGFDCLVCLGGGGTQKTAYQLHKAGELNVMTLPKTIDNDVAETDITFGFDTAMSIATEAIDRLHTTATSHDRIIVVEVMGHNAGWLALGSGIAGGADVILIPEIPYDTTSVTEYLLERQRRQGKKFSIIVVAEGARSREEVAQADRTEKKRARSRNDNRAENGGEPLAESRRGPGQEGRHTDGEDAAVGDTDTFRDTFAQESRASSLARQLSRSTRTEARVTSLGHVQRGGVPTAADRLLCTQLGVRATELLAAGVYNVLVAVQNGRCVPVPLQKVAGITRRVPLDHPWVRIARRVGTCLGVVDSELPIASDGEVP